MVRRCRRQYRRISRVGSSYSGIKKYNYRMWVLTIHRMCVYFHRMCFYKVGLEGTPTHVQVRRNSCSFRRNGMQRTMRRPRSASPSPHGFATLRHHQAASEHHPTMATPPTMASPHGTTTQHTLTASPYTAAHNAAPHSIAII